MAPGPGLPGDPNPAFDPPFELDPNCYAYPNAARFPWEVLEATIRRIPTREGTRVVAAATGVDLIRFGVGAAFAIAREPDGCVSLYAFVGEGDVAAYEEAMLSVREVYMRPASEWQLLIRVPSMADFISWLQSESSGLGGTVESYFAGAEAVVQYITCPEHFESLDFDSLRASARMTERGG